VRNVIGLILKTFQKIILYFASVFAGYVQDALKETTDYDRELDSSILKSIVAAEGVDIRDKIATLIDVVSGGIDSVCFGLMIN
jgi:hypothetical protein